MSQILKLATLVFIPTLSLGCALKQSERTRLHKPEVICGPPIEFGYTVPQWSVLPANPATCCLPGTPTLPQFDGLGLIETPSRAALPDDEFEEPVALPPALPPQAAGRANALKPPVSEPTQLDPPAASVPSVPPPYPTASPSDRLPTNGDSLLGPSSEQLDPKLKLPPVSEPTEANRPQVQDWDELNLPTLPWAENAKAAPYLLDTNAKG